MYIRCSVGRVISMLWGRFYDVCFCQMHVKEPIKGPYGCHMSHQSQCSDTHSVKGSSFTGPYIKSNSIRLALGYQGFQALRHCMGFQLLKGHILCPSEGKSLIKSTQKPLNRLQKLYNSRGCYRSIIFVWPVITIQCSVIQTWVTFQVHKHNLQSKMFNQPRININNLISDTA